MASITICYALHFSGLVQHCRMSIDNSLEILQFRIHQEYFVHVSFHNYMSLFQVQIMTWYFTDFQRSWNSWSCIAYQCLIHSLMLHWYSNSCTYTNTWLELHMDGFMQKRCNSIANAMELHLFCISPSIYTYLSSAILLRKTLVSVAIPAAYRGEESRVVQPSDRSYQSLLCGFLSLLLVSPSWLVHREQLRTYHQSEAGTKWLPFCRQHLQMPFPAWNLMYFESNFTGVLIVLDLFNDDTRPSGHIGGLFPRVKLINSVSSGNGFAPGRWQAIT